MKILVGFVLSAAALAQTHPALGGAYVSSVISRPLGGFSASAVSTRPLGGVASGTRRSGSGSKSSSRYVGPVYYVPNAFDASAYLPAYSTSYSQPDGASVAQPMVVNNYFISKGSNVPDMPPPEDTRQNAEEAAPPQPGDPLVEPASYYLISYKDHSVYPALAYWIEGDTLHYVTTQNTHNQASLSLIDIDQTYKLNADRSVPFTVPGR